jgi:uncharacterized OB-fold protein
MSEQPSLHSRRTLTLRFDIPISKTYEFWDSLKSGRFVTTKCSKCGNVSFPPQADCPKCMGSDFKWVDIGTEAILVTYTHVRMTPASFAEDDPYVIAIGEFPRRLKVLAWLEGLDPKDAKLGMKLRIVSRTAKGGNPYYVFVPA